MPQKSLSETTPPPTPKPAPQPQQKQTKPMPEEIKIIAETFESIEEILWAARNKLYQLYGPIDYTSPASIATKFTEEQESKLSFESKGEYWIVKPKQFLGEQMFGEIAARVRTIGGEYISAGRDSHFRVRKA